MLKIIAMLSLMLFGLTTNVSISAAPYGAVDNPARSAADRERDKTSKPNAVLDFIGVKPGMTVLDLFAGGGYYSELLSYAVNPDGRVISHTNATYESITGEEAAERFKDGRLPNVSRLVKEINMLELEASSLDMVLMVMIYHDVYFTADYWPKVDRDNFFRQIRESLKPGGVLVVIDHAAIADTGMSAAQNLHRIDEVFAKQDIESAGFVFDSASEVLRNPSDARTLTVFNGAIRKKTDRFVYRFIKNTSFN
ncbi:MAG: class I SAM-dependent methyltransferase [Porticoccaceae bacterium]|nr:class I SAM-dependent methyltransferase [Porticoccaceae bacterium]